jgi:hypothetical protein
LLVGAPHFSRWVSEGPAARLLDRERLPVFGESRKQGKILTFSGIFGMMSDGESRGPLFNRYRGFPVARE